MSYHRHDMIEIIYIDKTNHLSQRFIKIIAHCDERILAYCYTKKQLRTFRIEHILGMRNVVVS